jgi:hypothetical protein
MVDLKKENFIFLFILKIFKDLQQNFLRFKFRNNHCKTLKT